MKQRSHQELRRCGLGVVAVVAMVLAARVAAAQHVTGGNAIGGSATGGSAVGGSATGGSATGGSARGGDAVGGHAIGGSATSGAVSGGSATAGTATSGTATAGTATGGTATSGHATAGSATATLNGRNIRASADGGVSIRADGDRAVVQLGRHRLVVGRDQILIDGTQRARLSPSAADVQITLSGDQLTIRADGEAVHSGRL